MAKKRDVGMAGSSGYDSEFYTTDKTGKVQRNERTMKLQGMDPKKRMADSVAQEKRVNVRNANDLPMTDRDNARAKAVDGTFLNRRSDYDEKMLQNQIGADDVDKRQAAFDRGYSASVDVAKQKRQGDVMKKFGDNSFNSFKQSSPMTKAMMADYKKKGGK
jgi:hypothetical protein